MRRTLFLILTPLALFSMTAQEVVQGIQRSNLSLKSQKYHTEEMQLLHKSQRRSMLPSISLAGGYTHLGDPLQVDMSQARASVVDGLTQQTINLYDDISGNLPVPLPPLDADVVHSDIDKLYADWDVYLAPQDYFLASVIVKQPLLLGGKLLGAAHISGSQLTIAEKVEQKKQDFITQEALVLYIGILFAKDQIHLRDNSLKALIQHQEITEKLIAQGILPGYYVLGAKAAVELAEVQRNQARSFGKVQATTLKTKLNIPQDSSISIPDSLHYLPLRFSNSELSTAVEHYSPELQMNLEMQEIAQREKRIAAGAFVPSIFAIGEVQLYQKNLPVITPPWMVGVQAQWDIFNGTRNILLTKSAKLAEERSEVMYEHTQQEIAQKVQTLYQGVLIAQELYQATQKTVELFEASFSAVNKEYLNGRAKSFEVLDAQKRLDDVMLQELTALYSYTIQLTELYTLSGRITQFATEFDTHEN